MKKIFLIIFIILFSINLFPFSFFNFMNNSNHPELEWYIYRTDNFDIVYNHGLKKIAKKAGNISERVYAYEQANLGLKFDKRYRIFISDMDDIGNGFTLPTGAFYIYVNPSQFIRNFTGTEIWLRKVIAHEMVHALIMENTKTWLDFFFPASGLTVSGQIHEGFAQYYSGESWGVKRGDSFVNLAIKDNNLSTTTDHFDNGGLMYGLGFSKIKFLNFKYNDDNIEKLFKYRNTIGLYNFKKSFKKLFYKDYKQFEKEWEKYMNVYYNWREGLSEQLVNIGDKIDKPEFKKITNIKYYKNINSYIIRGIKNSKSPDIKLYRYNLNNNKLSTIAVSGIGHNFDLNEKRNTLIFSRLHRSNNNSLVEDIYTIDLSSKKEKQITKNGRNFEPQFYNDYIIYIHNNKKNLNIYSLNPKNKKTNRITNFSSKMQIYDLYVEKYLVSFGFFNPKKKSYGIGLINLKTGNMKRFYFKNQIRHPIINSKNQDNIYFTKYEDDARINIFKLNLKSGKIKRITNQSNLVMNTDFYKENLLSIAKNSRNNHFLININKNRKVNYFDGKIRKYYNSWKDTEPKIRYSNFNKKNYTGQFIGKYYPIYNIKKIALLPIPTVIEGNITPGFISLWTDDLNKNLIFTSFGYNPNDFKNSNYSIAYINKSTLVDITLGYGYLDKYTNSYAKKTLLEREEAASLNIKYIHNNKNSLFKNHTFKLGFRYKNNNLLNKNEFNISIPDIANNSFYIPENYLETDLYFSYVYNYTAPYKYFKFDSLKINFNYHISDKNLGSDFNNHFYNLYSEKYFPINFDWVIKVKTDIYYNEGNFPKQKYPGIKKYTTNYSFNCINNLIKIKESELRGLDYNFYGLKYFTGSFEIRKVINNNLLLLSFIDYGKIWKNNLDSENNDIGYAGIESQLRIGPLKLSYGFAKDIYNPEREINTFWDFSFQMGL